MKTAALDDRHVDSRDLSSSAIIDFVPHKQPGDFSAGHAANVSRSALPKSRIYKRLGLLSLRADY